MLLSGVKTGVECCDRCDSPALERGTSMTAWPVSPCDCVKPTTGISTLQSSLPWWHDVDGGGDSEYTRRRAFGGESFCEPRSALPLLRKRDRSALPEDDDDGVAGIDAALVRFLS